MYPVRSGPYAAFWWFVFLWIHRWRYTSLETKSLFACVHAKGKSITEREGLSGRVWQRFTTAAAFTSNWHMGGSPRAEQSVCQPVCYSCGHMHGKLGFSLGTSHCAFQACTEHGISMSTMHDHILCLGLSTRVSPTGAHHLKVTMMMVLHFISWPVSSKIICFS